jgi:hypothetical protein
MPDAAPNPDDLLARRLDYLFRTVHPASRKGYMPAAVAAAINEAAGEIGSPAVPTWGSCARAAKTTPARPQEP